MIRWDRIDDLRLTTLRRLRAAHIVDDYYLSGGTALALHLGHRVSVDLDLFSRDPRTSLPANSIIQKCQDAFGMASVRVGVRQEDQLWLHLNGVQTTFLAWPFERKYPLFAVDGMAIADPRDILAQEAFALGRRAAARDYVDIAYGLRAGVSSIDGLMRDAEEVFILSGAPLFSRQLFLQQLVYTDDLIDKDAAEKCMHEAISFDEMAGTLRQAVSDSTRRGLSIPEGASVVNEPDSKRVTLQTWPHGYIRSSTGILHLRIAPKSSKALCGKSLGLAPATMVASIPSRGRFCRVCGEVLRAKQNPLPP